jgi:hypothetical protein
MPKNQVSDLITDQEIAFALLILAGAMTDRQAAEAVGLNPDTAAYTKAKPRVVAFMHEHRAAVRERLVQQETEEVLRQNRSREKVLNRLWEIAHLDPEVTRNSAAAQIKALSMIVAIEGLILPRTTNDRRPQIDPAAVLREQQAKTARPEPSPDPVGGEDGPGAAVAAPSDPGPTPEPTLDARVSAPAPDNRVPSSIEKKPDTLRLRLS